MERIESTDQVTTGYLAGPMAPIVSNRCQTPDVPTRISLAKCGSSELDAADDCRFSLLGEITGTTVVRSESPGTGRRESFPA